MDSAGHGKNWIPNLSWSSIYGCSIYEASLSQDLRAYFTSHGLYHVRTDTQVKAKQHKTKIKQFLLWISLLSIGEDNYYTALKIIC